MAGIKNYEGSVIRDGGGKKFRCWAAGIINGRVGTRMQLSCSGSVLCLYH